MGVSENEVYPPNGNFHWEEEVTPVDLGVRRDAGYLVTRFSEKPTFNTINIMPSASPISVSGHYPGISLISWQMN